jgi:hypothetical protein
MPATPLQQLAAQVTVADHRYNLETSAVAQHRAAESALKDYARYEVSKLGSSYLAGLAIAHNPQAPGVHPHPVSKTMHDYILTCELPHLLADAPSLYVCCMKKQKFDRLTKHIKCPARLENFVTVPEDRIRFGNDAPPPPHGTGPLFSEPWCLFHEVGHHFTPADLLTLFRNNPTLSCGVFTIIIPPEILCGVKENSTPAYSYTTEGPWLHYAPDGCWDASYTQPVSSAWWLKASYLHDLNLHLTLTPWRQMGSNFVYTVHRGKTLTRTTHFASFNQQAVLRYTTYGLFSYLQPVVTTSIAVPTSALSFLTSYLKTTDSPTRKNVYGRFRIWTNDNKDVHLPIGADQAIVSATCASQLDSAALDPTFNPLGGMVTTACTLGLFGRYGCLGILINAAREERLRKTCTPLKSAIVRVPINSEPYFLTGLSENSPFFSGKYKPRSLAEIRAVMQAIAIPPPASAELGLPLLGMGETVSLARAGLGFLFDCQALQLCWTHLPRINWLRHTRRFIDGALKLRRFLGPVLFMACIPAVAAVAATFPYFTYLPTPVLKSRS